MTLHGKWLALSEMEPPMPEISSDGFPAEPVTRVKHFAALFANFSRKKSRMGIILMLQAYD